MRFLFFIILNCILSSRVFRRFGQKNSPFKQAATKKRTLGCRKCQIFGAGNNRGFGTVPDPEPPTKLGATVYIKYFSPSIVGNKRVLFTRDIGAEQNLYQSVLRETELITEISKIMPDITPKIERAVNDLVALKSESLLHVVDEVLNEELSSVRELISYGNLCMIDAVTNIFEVFKTTMTSYFDSFTEKSVSEDLSAIIDEFYASLEEIIDALKEFIETERELKFQDVEKHFKYDSDDLISKIISIFTDRRQTDEPICFRIFDIDIFSYLLRNRDEEIQEKFSHIISMISKRLSDSTSEILMNYDKDSSFDIDLSEALKSEASFKILELGYLLRSVFRNVHKMENIEIIESIEIANLSFVGKLESLFKEIIPFIEEIEDQIYDNEANGLPTELINEVGTIVSAYRSRNV